MESTEPTMVLVQRARGGDRAALEALCARYLPRLQRWAHGRLPAWARGAVDTNDLVQMTLSEATRRIDAFQPRHEGAFQAYVRTALLNHLRNELRRAQRRGPHDALGSGAASPEPSPLEEAIGSELLEAYETALDRLKPEDREAIVARAELGLSWSEIAAMLEKNSAASAQMTVSRALVRLAKEIACVRTR
jgi:RNA polymerase sigma-70 factor (ECF subfamily)